MVINTSFRGLASWLSLLLLSSLLAACGGSGGSNSSGVNNTTSEASATLAKDTIAPDSSPVIHAITPDPSVDGQGNISLEVDESALTEWQGKIVVLPPSDDLPDGLMMKVKEITSLGAPVAGKVEVNIQYTTPELDEVFDEIHYNPGNLMDSAEFNRFYAPQPFTEDITQPQSRFQNNNIAGKSASVSGKRKWFPEVDFSSRYKLFNDGKKGFSLDLSGLTIMKFEPDDGILEHKQKIDLDGSIEFYLDNTDPTINKDSNSPLKQELIVGYHTDQKLNLNLSGSFDLSLADVSGLKCGEVASKKNSALKISGAKWRDNACLGGVSVGFAPLTLNIITGNGSTRKIKAPVSVDIFFTLNEWLKVEAEASLELVKSSTVKRGLTVDLSQDDNNKVKLINEEYDTEIFEKTGVKQTPQWNTTLSGDLSGEYGNQAGLAAALRVSNVYPIDIEGYGEFKTTAKVTTNLFSTAGNDTTFGGDFFCVEAEIEPKIGYYFSFGLSASLEKKIKILGWKKEIKVNGGYSFIHEGDLWKLDNPVKYESCNNYSDSYSIGYNINVTSPYTAYIQDVTVKDEKTDGNVSPTLVIVKVYNSDGDLLKEYSGGFPLTFTADMVGDYMAEIYLKLPDGTKIRKEAAFTINGSLAAPQQFTATPGDGKITLSWNTVPNATGYSLCLATASITDIANCTSYANGGWFEPILTTQIDVTALADGQPLVNGQTYYFRIIAQDANGNESPASEEVSATPRKTPAATGKLNDTGITTCSDESSNGLPCPVSGYPGQDAGSGRDVTNNDDSDGHAGFSFTKISSTGAELPSTATDWACVKDNVTGLIWEVKTDDGGLHDKDDAYTWYEPDGSKNGGFAGYQKPSDFQTTWIDSLCYGHTDGDAVTYCNTKAYVERVNTAGWCGATDWRMPTREDLHSIVSYDRYSPAIDTNWFPNTSSTWFWSASPSADGNGAWGVPFGYGVDLNGGKGFNNQVRLVRSGQ